MELTPSQIPLTFEVTFFNSGLHVAMSVYDTTSSPTLVQGPTAMTNVVANTYIGFFTPIANHSYLILKAVYTDGTFLTLDETYSQGSESIIADYSSSGGGSGAGCSIIGLVSSSQPIIGLVNC